MEARVNRAEVLLENWKELEKKLIGFGGSTGMTRAELLRQQYGFLSLGLMRLGVGAEPHEKPQVQLLQASLSRLEKQLWPNPIVRFFVRLKEQFFDRPARQREFGAMKEENLAELKKFMVERGFAPMVERLSDSLDYERKRIALTMSGQLDPERLVHLTLGLEMDPQGAYRPQDIRAVLLDALKEDQISFDFPVHYGLDAPMVVNLIQGRSVCIGQPDGVGGTEEKWLGLYHGAESLLGEFGKDHGFRVEEQLKELARSVGMPGLDDERLVAELKKGNQIAFDAGPPFLSKLQIEADPGQKALIFRDHMNRPRYLFEVLREKQGYQKELETRAGQIEKSVKLDRGLLEQKGMGI